MQYKSYLQECIIRKGCLARWPVELMPLKVYIAPFRWYKSLSEAQAYKYKGMVINAFNTWQSALSGMINFMIVDSMNDSNINVEWRRVDRKSLGHCQFNHDNFGRYYSAEVSIGISDGILHKKYMDENEVYHTILHEVGHAIGLHHSPDINDIMYTPHQYGRTHLSTRDIQTARFMYKFEIGKTESEILSQYSNLKAKNIDHLVMIMLGGKTDFQKAMDGVEKNAQKKDLIQESTNIGDLKKYLIQLNSIKYNFNKKDET